MTIKDYDSWDKSRLVAELKRLSSRKKYGLVWEEKPEAVVEQCKSQLPVLEEVTDRILEIDASLPTNFIIEGDNYHALSVLNYTHAGKIDVIYIDPPYNTGAKDWKYNNDYVDANDTYRHSKWLSMMHSRLLLAKKLLKEDGALICAIDENEQAHLGVMLEEIFPDKKIDCITIIHNHGGIQGLNFSYCHEYAYFIYPLKGSRITPEKRTDGDLTPFRDWGKENSKRELARNCFYPILVKNGRVVGFGDIPDDSYHPEVNVLQKDGSIAVYPIDKNGIERRWRFARNTVDEIIEELVAVEKRGVFSIERMKQDYTRKTVWTDAKYNANIYGTQLLSKILDAKFPFPKSLHTVKECLEAFKHSKNATILDFFAGSGTTAHAVLKLNQEDGGQRKFILVTNNENNIAEQVTYPRVKSVIEGYAEESSIPANLRYFKTAFVKKSEVSDDTRRELIQKSAEMICLKESTFKKVYDNKKFKIYQNETQVTGVLFDLDAIAEFKERLAKVGMKANIYVFSLSSDNFAEDFSDLAITHKIRPIPEGILEVYRKIFA